MVLDVQVVVVVDVVIIGDVWLRFLIVEIGEDTMAEVCTILLLDHRLMCASALVYDE